MKTHEKAFRKRIQAIHRPHAEFKPKSKKRWSCLEISPGPGWIGIWLAENRSDLTVIGLEPSADMRRVARINAE